MSLTSLEMIQKLQGREVFDATEVPFGTTEQARTLTVNGVSISKNLSATTTPKINKPPVSLAITIAGDITIDLTAVAGLAMPPGATRTLDMTTAKLVAFIMKAKSDNSAVINVAPGAANPYPIFGAGNDIDIPKGFCLTGGFVDVASELPAVSGTVKTIKFAGTDGNILYVDLYFGIP